MTNRRQFIQSGIAVSAASSMGMSLSVAGSSAGEQPETLKLERFIFDLRFAEAYDIGQLLGRAGVPISGFADDLMSLWYDDLDLRWRDAPMAIAGVTLNEALFVLETLAMDRGMRLIYRGDHSAVSNGRIAHSLNGPAGMLAGLSPRPGDSTWVSGLAGALSQCPWPSTERGSLEFVTTETGLALRDVPLCSWIIAPRHVATTTKKG